MNGLVVHTMGLTGYARLNSNKDANNCSPSCRQGCESWPFTGERTPVQVHKKQEQTVNGFSGGILARFFKWPCVHCPLPLQSYHKIVNRPKQMKNFLCVQPSNCLPSYLLLPPGFPKRSGYSEDSASLKVCNLSLLGRAHLHFSKLLTERRYWHLGRAQFQWNPGK